LVSCDATTANGVALATNSTLILYPSSTNNIADSFTYTVSDGYGGIASNIVSIVISNTVAGQSAGITVSGGAATMNFFGIPGYKYSVQRSQDGLNNWQDLTSVTVLPTGTVVDNNGVITAPVTGAFTVTDSDPPQGASSVFYQLRVVP
jgi:hypothetical protein